jgi:hypothetical protein
MYHQAGADGSISPVVDKLLFPDMKGLVDTIHGMGLYAGWCVRHRATVHGQTCTRLHTSSTPDCIYQCPWSWMWLIAGI